MPESSSTTILDVLDNFLTVRRAIDFDKLPGRDLWRLGNEIRRFAASYEPPSADTSRVPMYIGGWPSANFFHAEQGQLVLSTLLYSGQVYAKDPLANWFSNEQYQYDKAMACRQGYLAADGSANIAGTRGFLRVVVPALQRLRPLIESGALVLVPTEAFLATHDSAVQMLQGALLDRVGADLDAVIRQFHPRDLAVDDRVRGGFMFAGGDRAVQLRRALARSLTYFAQEWLIAQRHGVEYTAPWSFEQFVCEQGLGHLIGDGPHQRAITGLLHSQLPLFQGLSPQAVADVRDEATFGEFRANLLQVYRELPRIGTGPHFLRDLAQTEQTLLGPIVERTRREADRGILARIGITLAETGFSVGMRVLFDTATGDLGWKTTARELVGTLADRVRAKNTTSSSTAWITLHRHHRTISDELPAAQPRPGDPPDLSPWFIDRQPSMQVRVSPGLMLMDDRPLTGAEHLQQTEKVLCACNSGLDWTACCRGLPSAIPTTSSSTFWHQGGS